MHGIFCPGDERDRQRREVGLSMLFFNTLKGNTSGVLVHHSKMDKNRPCT